MKKYLLELTVFISGLIVMIFEIVGSRVFGPYFGTSTFVWTTLIGVVLGSLSIGYYFGGKIADKEATFKKMSLILLMSGFCIGIMIFIKDGLLSVLQDHVKNINSALIVGGIILFSPTSIFLGMVSPYAAKLRIKNLSTSGADIGRLYALSTCGSIVGTFLAGFYLIPFFGTNTLLSLLAIVVIIFSIVLFYEREKFLLLLLFCGVFWFVSENNIKTVGKNFVDVDTRYNRVWIYDEQYEQNKKQFEIRKMGINNENHSAMLLMSDQLVNEYTKYYHLSRHFHPHFRKSLIFGGAGYSFPKDYLKVYPHATIDVVEIDPGVTELAKKYFSLKENSRMNIYHEDGRVFLNKNIEKYDVIFGDAFGSRYAVPYHMTTVEAVQKMYDTLYDNGVVIVNLISSVDGKNDFLRAEYYTYKKIFPQVYLFRVQNQNERHLQNIMLVALKSQKIPQFTSEDKKIDEFLKNRWSEELIEDVPILTDDYAPVEYYMRKVL
ncbi:MAG: spermidine synthase [Candidatus Moraniibacteriota bacterium]|nr:MAG: spermidine synthase [Candidatus Moranbacteria bacterium]